MATVYLNQAGTTWPKPEPVSKAIAAALETQAEDWPEEFSQAHREVASFFGIEDTSRLLLTPGCTSALALAVADHAWQPSDRVLLSGWEHHALHRQLLKLTELDVQLEVLPPTVDGPLDLERLESSLVAGGVRMVAVSAASNVTGDLLPLEEIGALAHQHGAKFLVDGAQIAGWWKLDLPNTDIDLFAFGGHKGMHGAWGIGGLYVAPQLSMNTPVATCDVPAAGEPATCAVMPGYCDAGSVDRLALAGLQAAVRWLRGPAQADRTERSRRMIARLSSALQTHSQVIVYGQSDPQLRMPTVAFNVRGRSSSDVAGQLAAQGVIAAGGLQCAPLAHEVLGTAPEGAVRLSAGPMNSEQDIEQALEAIAMLS